MDLLQPQFLIFFLPVAAALVYIILMAAGLVAEGHGGPDADHDLGGEAGHDAGHDSGDGAGHGHGAAGAAWILDLLGVGRVPLSILFMSWCILWGASGFLIQGLFKVTALDRVCLYSAVVALVGTRLIAEAVANVLLRGSYTVPREDLLGLSAEVLYDVTPESGTVRVLDQYRNLLDLPARTRGSEPIKAGTEVVLAEYDPGADLFYVEVTA